MDYSNLPFPPCHELLLDGAEDCFLALCDAMDKVDVLTHADPLTTTLAANALLLYKGIVDDIGATGTNGQTVTANIRRKKDVVIKKDQRVDALCRVQKDLLSLLDRLLLPSSIRLKLIQAKPSSPADAAFDAFLKL